MARQLKPDTPLARMILDSGKPAYVVAGEVQINYNRLLDYADGRMPISPVHRVRLTRYFGIDPANSSGCGSTDTSPKFEPACFGASVQRVRAVPGHDCLLVLSVAAMEGQPDAWTLNDAAGLVLAVTATDRFGDVLAEFSASVEELLLRPDAGLLVRLRVPADERDVLMRLGRARVPLTFIVAVQPDG